MPAAPNGFTEGHVLSPGPHFVTFAVTRGAERFVCKRLSARWMRDESAWEMLRREARLLGKLRAHAPALVETGDDAHGPFLVMEAIAHAPLTPGAPRDPAWIRTAAATAFEALARIHEARDEAGPLDVVHGDVRPENLAMTDDARSVTFLDFGLAAWREAPAAARDSFRGTLLYAAPEAARGEALDRRADIFSLAAALLHVASGVAPREAPSAAAMLTLAAESPVEAWARSAARDADATVIGALVESLAYQASDRPASARDVAARLVLKPGA